MLATGMLVDEDEPFGTVMRRYAMIEERAKRCPQARAWNALVEVTWWW